MGPTSTDSPDGSVTATGRWVGTVMSTTAGGTRTLAVATGNYSFEELSRTGADHVIGDLSDTDEVLSLLTQ